MDEVVITTPLGKRCSSMSSASKSVLLNGGVRRLSDGEEKLRR